MPTMTTQAPIISSTETNVPAKVPRNRPYLNVSFKDLTIASLFVSTPSFLNTQTDQNKQQLYRRTHKNNNKTKNYRKFGIR